MPVVNENKFNTRERGMILRYTSLSVRKDLQKIKLTKKETAEMAAIERRLKLSREAILDTAEHMTMEAECGA